MWIIIRRSKDADEIYAYVRAIKNADAGGEVISIFNDPKSNEIAIIANVHDPNGVDEARNRVMRAEFNPNW